ncbi:hypothetical protein GGI02_002918 [Coemansia sp. RSA 2322]|nr:hypothetical protein GGI02_002918 [Coemansia sp. RSA 2322]
MSTEVSQGLPRPQRTISDEFRELQHIVNLFQHQLDAPHGTVGLHPFGPVNVAGAKMAFTQACRRLREALTSYRGTALESWGRLISKQSEGGGLPDSSLAVLTHKVTAAGQELNEMRRVVDTLHEDASKCGNILTEAAADAISKALAIGGLGGQQAQLLVERLKSMAKRLGLAHYTDTQTHMEETVTTVTLAGSIIVIDVDIGNSIASLKVKVSYVSDMDHDERIDALMLDRLHAADIRGFEALVEEMAELDRLTKEQSPVSFIHNTFAIVATLAEVQARELSALGGDSKQLLRHGSGIALPHARHVGPSLLYFMPSAIRHGLMAADFDDMVRLHSLSERTRAVAPLCHWLSFSWEPSDSRHGFLSAQSPKYCLPTDYMAEDSESHHVVRVHHPGISGLDMQFLELTAPESVPKTGKPVDDSITQASVDSGAWIPYCMVARLEPTMPASALTVRAIMAAIQVDTSALGPDQSAGVGLAHDSPRLLENAPTLEGLVRGECAKTANTSGEKMEMGPPQIRAWTICRIPLYRPQNVLAVVPILRRQAIFNSLLASCYTDAVDSELPLTGVSARTHANDPFRIDLVFNNKQLDKDGDIRIESGGVVDQGVVLRVIETTGEVAAWIHQSLGIASTEELLAALGSIATTATTLCKSMAHPKLSKVADISHSIPAIAVWLASHPL